jgi:hypothetical protein
MNGEFSGGVNDDETSQYGIFYDDQTDLRNSSLPNLDRNISIDTPSRTDVIKVIKSLQSGTSHFAPHNEIDLGEGGDTKPLNILCSCKTAKERRCYKLRQL